jgi:predicted amidophosphoribosyltransferase
MINMDKAKNITQPQKCPDCKLKNKVNASICKNCGKQFQNTPEDPHTGDYESYKYGEKIRYN